MQHRGTARRRVLIVSGDAPAGIRHGGRRERTAHRHSRLDGRRPRASPSCASTASRTRSTPALRSRPAAFRCRSRFRLWATFTFPEQIASEEHLMAGQGRRAAARLAAHAVRAAGSTCSIPRRSTSRSPTSRMDSPASRAGTARPAATMPSRWRSTRCWSRTSFPSSCPSPSPDARLTALLHDAPEYVIGDMISPFKSAVGGGYKAVEQRLQRAIHLRFGLPADTGEKLRRGDQAGRPGRRLFRGDAACGIFDRRGHAILRPSARHFRRSLRPRLQAGQDGSRRLPETLRRHREAARLIAGSVPAGTSTRNARRNSGIRFPLFLELL